MGTHWTSQKWQRAAARGARSGANRPLPLLACGLGAVAVLMLSAPLFAGKAMSSEQTPAIASEPVYLGRLLDAQPTAVSGTSAGAAVQGAEPVRRFRGRLDDGLAQSLGESGIAPAVARSFLTAVADRARGLDIGPDDYFDLVADMAAPGGPALVYAALDRVGASDVQLIRMNGRWVDAAGGDRATRRPVPGRMTSRFGVRMHPLLGYSRMHKGVDFAATYGSPVVAAASGTITRAGWAGGYGRQVRVAHANGLASSYSHLSRFAVEAGSAVQAGQVIGYAGSSGLSTGPHVHYEVTRNGRPVDPLGTSLAGGTALDPATRAQLRERLAILTALPPQPRR